MEGDVAALMQLLLGAAGVLSVITILVFFKMYFRLCEIKEILLVANDMEPFSGHVYTGTGYENKKSFCRKKQKTEVPTARNHPD